MIPYIGTSSHSAITWPARRLAASVMGMPARALERANQNRRQRQKPDLEGGDPAQ